MHDNENALDELTDAQRSLLHQVKTSFYDLRNEISLFEDSLLDEAELMYAHAYRLPNYTDEDIGQWPETIDVSPLQGLNALKYTLEHIKNLTMPHDHSGRIIQRIPGIIGLSHPDPQSLRLRIATINKKKHEFHAWLKHHLPDPNVRFLLLTNAMPNVVKLKAFRDILFTNRELYSVGFTWKHRQSINPLKKAALLLNLEKTMAYYKSRFPLSPKWEDVEREITIISRYPSTSAFLQVRDLRVSPSMNLRYQANAPVYIPDRKAPTDMIAHSPLFVFNQEVRIHPLKPYFLDNDRTPYQPKGELVIPRLNVYFDPKRSAGN